jgi:phage-related minor tail protein
MDLQELRFVVKTEELVDAAKKIEALGTAINKLNKPMQEMATASDKVAKASEKKTKAEDEASKSAAKLDKLLEKLNSRYADMANGSTSAEASVLHLARSLGATTENALKPYKTALENIRELSKSPFDSAIGSVRSISQEYESMTHRAELASKGIFLTTNQLKEYSKIASEIKGKLKAADLDPTKGEGLEKFNSELKTQQGIYLGIANQVNTLKAAEKDRNDALNSQMKEMARLQEASDNLFKYNQLRHTQDQQGYKRDMADMKAYYSQLEKTAGRVAQTKASKPQAGAMDDAVTSFYKSQAKAVDDVAKANAYLAKEIYRVDNALKAENESLSSGSNNALLRFEKALKSSGLTLDQQAAKLDNYRQKLAQLQKTSGDRQVDYLSRALGPQITDIAVGLATGQNPLTVMLQQGGQLRDQFALAGVAGKDMGNMLKTAAASMVTSIKDVSMAVGGLLISVLADVGKKVGTTLIAPFTLLNQVLRGTIGTTEALGIAMNGVAKTGLLAVISAAVMLAVEYYKLTSAQSALSKSIALTGASFGMSTQQAEAFAANMAKSGGSTLQFMSILNDFAKVGAKADETTIRLAKDLEKYAGQAAEKTAESYAKLSDAPTKGLLDIAKAQGFVSKATLDKVNKLEQEGRTYEAIALAQDAWKESNQRAVDVIKSELNPLQELWFKIKDGITAAGEAVYEFASSSTVVNILTTTWEVFAVIVAEVWYVLKQTVQTVIDLVNVLTAPVGTKLAVFDAAVEAAKKAREEHDKSIASILNRKEATKGLTAEEVKQREVNANAAKVAEDRWKKEKESTDFFQSSMKSAKDLIIGTTQAQGELNDAERKYLEITNDPKYAKLTEARQKELKWLFDIAAVKVDQLKLDKQITDENLKLAEENADLMLQAKLIGASDTERKKAVKTRKAEVELQKELVEIQKSGRGDVEAARAAAYERYAQKIKNANLEISIELVNNLTNSLSDAVIVGLTEGGKAGSKKLREVIKAELMKPITIVVQAVVGSIVQSATSSLLGSAAGSAGGSLAGSLLGNAASAAGLTSVFGSASAYGAAIGTTSVGAGSQAAMLAAQTGEFGAAGTAATSSAAAGAGSGAAYYGGYAAGALGGMALNRGISGEYQISKDVSTIQDIATIAATAMFGPIGGIIAGAASGVMNRAFGMGAVETTASGISGTFGANGADVKAYQKWQQSGGWFRSDKSGTNFSDIPTQLREVLDFALGASTGLTESYAKLIGANTDNIRNFTKQVDISLKGLDAAGQQAAIEQSITEYGEDLAATIVGKVSEITIGVFTKSLNPMIKVGETSSQALSRLATSLTTVNGVLETLNQTLFTASITGADAASKLADAFGGLETFTSATSAYYEAFYSEEERNAKTIERLQAAFAALGLALPDTLSGFRAIVDAQNLYTDEGRKTYATLLGLSSAFATVTNSAEEAAKATAESMRAAGQSISDWLKKLVGEIVTPQASLSATRSAYTSNLSLARANDPTALGSITGSAEAYLAAAKATATTSAQYKLAVAQVVTQVSGLPAVKGYNDLVLEKLGLISTYTDDTATNTLDAYQTAVEQVDYLIKLNNNALYNVYTAIGGAYPYYTQMIEELKIIASKNTVVNVSGGGGGFNPLKPSSWFADGGVFGGQGVYSEPTMFMQPTGQLGVMGEAGPEAVMPLERLADGALGVRAVTSIASSGDSSMLWQAIDRLNANVDGLRAETRATVVNTSKTAKLLDRVVESDTIKVQTVTA